MFLNNHARKIDKEIMKDESIPYPNEDCVINVKADSFDQIFSTFNYDNNDTLSPEFCDYVWKNAKLSVPSRNIKINIYSKNELKSEEVSKAIKSHYKKEYIEAKIDISKTNISVLVSLLLGILSLALLLVFHSILDNFYLTTITEIMAWVFVWEAIDKFFYERSNLKRKSLLIQRLYTAKVEIIKETKNQSLKEQSKNKA